MKRVFCIGNGESRRDFNLQNLRQYGKIYGCNALYRDFMPDVLTAVDHGIMHEIYHAGIAQKIPCYFRDWTKVPAMMYVSMLGGGMNEVEIKENIDGILVSNEQGDSEEFVMHGSNLKGIVDLIRRNGDKFKKNVNHSTIKVSWIKKPDYSHSISDIEPMPGQKTGDFGWACGATSGYVATLRENPAQIFLIGHDIHSATDKVNNMYKSTKHYVHKDNGPTPGLNWIKQWYTLFQNNPHINFYKVNQFNDGRDATNSPIEEWENNKKLSNVHYISHSTLDNMLKG